MSNPGWTQDFMERAFNAWLQQDPDAVEAMAALEGRVVGLELLGLGLTFYVHPHADGVRITTTLDGEPDTLLSGTPVGLAAMGLSKQSDKAFFSGQVSMRGDTELGQDFKQILDNMEFDWEEQLSHLLGDPAAHQTGRMFRHLRSTFSSAGNTLQQNLSEYLQEEARLLPSRIEIENLMSDIDRANEDTDRLDARIHRLSQPAQTDNKR